MGIVAAGFFYRGYRLIPDARFRGLMKCMSPPISPVNELLLFVSPYKCLKHGIGILESQISALGESR